MSESFKGDQQVRVAVLTISDTRTKETDTGGQLVQRLARNEGLELVDYDVVEDDIASIRVILSEWLENEEVDVIITTGGTGIAKRDVTLEAVKPFFEKEIDGFGELFRYVSFL